MLFNLVCSHDRGAVRLAGAHLHLLQRRLPAGHRRRASYGYFIVRQFRKDQVSPFRLPGFFRWIALAMGAVPHLRLLRRRVGTRPTSWSAPVRVTPSTSSASSSWPPTCRCTCWRRMTDRRDGWRPWARCRSWWVARRRRLRRHAKEPHVLDPAHGRHRHGGRRCRHDAPAMPPMPADRGDGSPAGTQWRADPRRRRSGSGRPSATSNRRSPRPSSSPRVGIPIPTTVIRRALELSGGRPGGRRQPSPGSTDRHWDCPTRGSCPPERRWTSSGPW